jgi:hypothetical protein
VVARSWERSSAHIQSRLSKVDSAPPLAVPDTMEIFSSEEILERIADVCEKQQFSRMAGVGV